MATSGVFTTNPEIADLCRESFERAGVRPSDIDWPRIEAALRSANFVLVDFANKGVKSYQMSLVTQTVTANEPAYTIDPGAQVFTAVLRRSGIDTPLVRISREDYEDIPNKAQPGRPSEIFFDMGTYGVTPRTFYLWPVPENSSDVVRMWVLQRPESVTQLAQTPPISWEWQDAFCDALALRLAKKFNPSLIQSLTADSLASFGVAQQADRDRSPLRLRVSTRGSRGWR